MTTTNWTGSDFWTGTAAPLLESTGLPPEAYTSQDFFEVEKAKVFERAWVCVGVTDDVATVGRLIVRTLGDRSVIIVRGKDDVVRGFLNSCRHRGTELADADCDVASMIRCPYHRWGYGLDGTLVATPFFDEVPRPDFDPTEPGPAVPRPGSGRRCRGRPRPRPAP